MYFLAIGLFQSMDELYNILLPHFTSGAKDGVLRQTDKGLVVVSLITGEDLSLNDSRGDYFYIRITGDKTSSEIEDTCKYVLNEIGTPVKVVAMFTNADLYKAENMLYSLISKVGTVSSSSIDYQKIMVEETGENPMRVMTLVSLDAVLDSQVAYDTCCTVFDICPDISCNEAAPID